MLKAVATFLKTWALAWFNMSLTRNFGHVIVPQTLCAPIPIPISILLFLSSSHLKTLQSVRMVFPASHLALQACEVNQAETV